MGVPASPDYVWGMEEKRDPCPRRQRRRRGRKEGSDEAELQAQATGYRLQDVEWGRCRVKVCEGEVQ